MKVTVAETDGCRQTLNIEVPAEEVNAQLDELVVAYSKQARVPGFRPGKTPAALVERRFRKEIADDARDRLLPKSYQDAIKEQGITPVQVVEVSEDVSVARDEPMTFNVVVDVPPAFELPTYAGIKVKREDVTVSEEDVDKYLDTMRERFGSYDEADRPIQETDFVKVSYTATSDGKDLAELVPEPASMSKAEDYSLIVGDFEMVPGLSEGLVGATAGEERTIEVTFPEEFGVEELAGVSATYTATATEIRERVLPSDEDFLKNVGVESMEKLREDVKSEMQQSRDRAEHDRVRNEIVQRISEQVEIPVPESLVRREQQTIIQDIVQRGMSQGASREQLSEHGEDIFQSAEQSSRDRVKTGFIIDRISEAEGIEVTDEDVAARMQVLSQQYQMPIDRLQAEITKGEDGMDRLRHDIRMDKTLDVLLEKADVS